MNPFITVAWGESSNDSKPKSQKRKDDELNNKNNNNKFYIIKNTISKVKDKHGENICNSHHSQGASLPNM